MASQAAAPANQEGTSTRLGGHLNRHRPWFQPWDTSARDEIEDEHGWLISFGDLMSLLLVMFVFIVAFMGSEPERYAVSRKTQPAEGTGQAAVPVEVPPTDTSSPPTEPLPPTPAPTVELDPVFKTLGDDVQVSVQKGQINLQIPDSILFAAGTANLNEAGLPVLDRIAELLKGSRYGVSIEGHTDNTPIRSLRYPSNWELSAARASAVLRYLIARGVPAERMRAIGYADTRPVAPNDNPASRAQNRRVALVLHLAPPSEGSHSTP